jgi:gliding motility-associated-like protein
VPGTSRLSYPLNSLYSAIPNPAFISGTVWQWNLSAINNLIHNNGLRSVLDSNLSAFKVVFKVVTNCNYTSGSSIRFKLNGTAACGHSVAKELVSPQLFITGATTPYNTGIPMLTSYLSPCAANSVMHISIINHGPAAVGASDSMVVILPYGVSYVNSSFTGIHNAPVNSNPTQLTLNNQISLKWKIPPGLQPADSSVFTFNYEGAPADLPCGISYFLANTLSTANVVCSSSGNACNIKVLTGYDTLAVFIYKAYLSLSSPHGYSVPNPPNGETANVNFTINNTGQDVFPVNSTVISYYYDSDGNGIYNTGDVFIANDTQHVSILSNGSYSYSGSVNVPSGKSCSIIALLDTAVSHCSCTPSQVVINLPMKNIGIDTFSCSEQAISLGFPPINGYNYLWSPSTGLADTISSSPLFTAINTSGSPIISHFVVTTNRIHCVSKDTVTITVYPNPTFTITGSDTICFGGNNGSARVTSASGGTPPYSYFWNTTPPQMNDTALNLSAGNYADTLKDARGCKAIQTITIYQPNTGLSAVIASPTEVTCHALCNGSAIAVPSGGTGNYTFLWNSSPAQTTAHATALCAGNYTVTVSDNDTSGCTAHATLIITEPAIFKDSVSVLNSNCNGGGNATATVTVSGGSAGYTYLWSNGQTTSSATGLSQGTYTITVTDSNSCALTDSAIVTAGVQVTAVPTASNICIGQNTTIKAVASGGTPTYTFLWNTAQTAQSITVSPATNTNYMVTVTDNNGCKDSSIIKIKIHSNPLANFKATKTAGCEPLCLIFQDSSFISADTIVQWLWNVGDGSAVSNSQTFEHCYFNDSIYSSMFYNVTLTVTSAYGCADTVSKNNYITVYPNPHASFSVQPQTTTIIDPVISITDLSTGVDFWKWNFGDHDTTSKHRPPAHTYSDIGTYTIMLITSNKHNCLDTAYQTVIIEPDFVFYIPSSFSPNDDGINDFFSGKGIFIKQYEMTIFDRWGNLIFYTDDINKPWDGKANHGAEVAQQDIYVYSIKLTDYKNGKHNYRGIVTLVK